MFLRPACVLPLLFAPCLAIAADDVRGDNPDSKPSTPEEERAMFHLPPGFEIQLVAAEPDIQKPINITFDGAGRLWVSGSQMYPWPAGTDAAGQTIPGYEKAFADIASAFHVGDKAPQPHHDALDTVRVLSDFDENGHAKSIRVFADGLNIPSGIQPLPHGSPAIAKAYGLLPNFDPNPAMQKRAPRGDRHIGRAPKGDSAIVYSIPNIWLLTDWDGDGVAESRIPLYGTAGYLDTHGGMSSFTYWIDGWIYGTHGFRNHSEIHDLDGRVTTLDSGNTYRFRPDGSEFQIYTHGQTNPFGLTFDPLGHLYSADSHSRPVYMLLHGGYYEGIGKRDDGLGFAPHITEDGHGSTAIGGIAYYADNKFPEEYRGNTFNGNPVTRRVNRDKLEWHGSTPVAVREPDFIVSDDPWFRPVQVKLGPDGALWIADFYNAVIGHYEFPLADPRRDHTHGRIWRVVYRGEKKDAPVANPPDLARMEPKDLVEKLNDSNLEVRRLATNELVNIRDVTSISMKLHKLFWKGVDHQPASANHRAYIVEDPLLSSDSATQIGFPADTFWEGDAAPVSKSDNAAKFEETLAAAHSLWALERIGQLDDEVLNFAAHRDALNRIMAFDIVAQRPTVSADLGQALEALKNSNNRFSEQLGANLLANHPMASPQGLDTWFATYDKAKPQDAKAEAKNPGDAELIYALKVALREQLGAPGAYEAADDLLGKSYPKDWDVVADVSLAVNTADAADFLLKYLVHTQLAAPRSGEYLKHVALYLPTDRFGEVADLTAKLDHAPLLQRLVAADGLGQASRQRGVQLPEAANAWMQRAMIDSLESGNDFMTRVAIEGVREATFEGKLAPLAKIVADEKRPEQQRIAALEALANLDAARPILGKALASPASMKFRKRAAELLGQSNTDEARAALLAALPTAPTDVGNFIAASLAGTDPGAESLISTIEKGKSTAVLLRNPLVAAALEKRPQSLRDRAAALTKDLPPEDERLDKVIAARADAFQKAKPDANHGAQIFQQNCAVCHKINNQGANIGPALDGIGARGAHRVIEDILDPNRNVDPMFRQTVVETSDGQTLAGMNAHFEGELLVLTDVSGKPVSVPRAKIKTQTPTKLSLMPPIFETTIAPADFNDLLAFLFRPAP
ncbi:MAG TPA: c-type cytochrome [Chthoniobacter sp.]|jgi:putative heme-binding domain-containing protein